MSKTAQDSQEKKVKAAGFANVGNGIFVLRLDFSDNLNCAVVGVLAENIENLIAQIETALADNQPFFTAPNGRRFICDPSVLRKIKTLLCGASRTDAGATHTHFCSIRGDSAAQALGSSANAQLTKGATRTVRGAKQISKAAAQAVRSNNPRTSSTRGERTLPARQFNNHLKSGRRSFNAGSKSPAAAAATERPLRLKGRRPLRQLACANESIPSSGVRDSRRESRAVSCLREASISRCGGVKARRHDSEKSPKPSGVAALGYQIRTKNGCTSVVVATRKVS